MDSLFRSGAFSEEFSTRERCHIREYWNQEDDDQVSVAHCRVEPGVTTERHRLPIDERYLILSGSGVIHLGDLEDQPVGPGDGLTVPAGAIQSITNSGTGDLCFLVVCTPAFRPEHYQPLE